MPVHDLHVVHIIPWHGENRNHKTLFSAGEIGKTVQYLYIRVIRFVCLNSFYLFVDTMIVHIHIRGIKLDKEITVTPTWFGVRSINGLLQKIFWRTTTNNFLLENATHSENSTLSKSASRRLSNFDLMSLWRARISSFKTSISKSHLNSSSGTGLRR